MERYYNTPPALQRTNTKISKQIFPVKELGGQSLNFHIHVSVSEKFVAVWHIATKPLNLEASDTF